MEKLRSYLVPDGLAIVSVPVGIDELRWNEQRIYGAVRLPHLLKGFGIERSFGFDQEKDFNTKNIHSNTHQPVFVLRAIDGQG
jgi:hypothetical protein